MRDKLFVDTNVLVYLTNESSEFHQGVLEQFEQISIAYDLFISRQVIREYAVIMTRPGIIEHPLTADEVVEDINTWKRLFTVVDETDAVTEKLLVLLKKYQLKGKRIHDANIVATMLAFSISSIFTGNEPDFKKFTEIRIIRIKAKPANDSAEVNCS
jgi:predicted nucleic acid-binding protein